MIVDDAADEKRFYDNFIGLDKLSDNVLEGPSIEKMIGLPPGAALDVSIWGKADQPYGQVEVIEYRGVDGNNLYSRATPKSLGILHVSYEAPRLTPIRRLLDAAAYRVQRIRTCGNPVRQRGGSSPCVRLPGFVSRSTNDGQFPGSETNNATGGFRWH